MIFAARCKWESRSIVPDTPFEIWKDTNNDGASVLSHIKEFGDGWKFACADDLGLTGSCHMIRHSEHQRCAAIFSRDGAWKYAVYSHRKNWILAVNALRAHSDGCSNIHILIIGKNVNEISDAIYKSIRINTVVV